MPRRKIEASLIFECLWKAMMFGEACLTIRDRHGGQTSKLYCHVLNLYLIVGRCLSDYMTYACMYIYIYIYLFIYLCMYVYIYICIFIYMCVSVPVTSPHKIPLNPLKFS